MHILIIGCYAPARHRGRAALEAELSCCRRLVGHSAGAWRAQRERAALIAPAVRSRPSGGREQAASK